MNHQDESSKPTDIHMWYEINYQEQGFLLRFKQLQKALNESKSRNFSDASLLMSIIQDNEKGFRSLSERYMEYFPKSQQISKIFNEAKEMQERIDNNKDLRQKALVTLGILNRMNVVILEVAKLRHLERI